MYPFGLTYNVAASQLQRAVFSAKAYIERILFV